MPTLRPQKLSGLVVIPTIELEGLVYTVSLAIDVGESRTGPGTAPPQVVTREDLIVEVKSASEGSFEPLGSPDPGPLPVHALRVVQARGTFTFSRGVNDPDEVVVTVRGDRKSFPIADTFATTAGLSSEPQEGDQFPGSSHRPPVSPRFPFPFPFPFLKPRCFTRRFLVPANVSADAAARSEFFEIDADFSAAFGRRWRCACCEYRQFVRGGFKGADANPVRFDLPSGPLDNATWREDGSIDEFGPGAHGYYGHRDTSSPGDAYTGSGGCSYSGNETSSCPPDDTAHLEFIGLIVDTCRRRVAVERTWTVEL